MGQPMDSEVEANSVSRILAIDVATGEKFACKSISNNKEAKDGGGYWGCEERIVEIMKHLPKHPASKHCEVEGHFLRMRDRAVHIVMECRHGPLHK